VTKRVLLTGGPGFGKSSIIEEMERRGLNVHHEIARNIIQNAIETNGTSTPWQDIDLFSKLVLEGRIQQFHESVNTTSFYDRGIPDIAGFLKKEKQAIPAALWQLCDSLKYFRLVFITPPWEAIFQKDSERKEDFVAAIKVHKALESIYLELGYQLIPVPMGSIKQRADFILNFPGVRS
jgi:predicted ATPase